MKLRTLALVMTSFVGGTFVTSVAFANGKGNGGVAHVCRDDKDQIRSIELLDLWKGRRAYPGIEYVDLEGDEVNYVGLATSRLARFPELYRLFTEHYSGLYGHGGGNRLVAESYEGQIVDQKIPLGYQIRYLDAVPVWSGDAEEGEPDTGCGFEQLGYYMAGGVLVVNRPLKDAMGHRDQGAFVTHEILYRIAKKYSGLETSALVQKIVAQLFSVIPDETELDRLVSQVYVRLPSSDGASRFFTRSCRGDWEGGGGVMHPSLSGGRLQPHVFEPCIGLWGQVVANEATRDPIELEVEVSSKTPGSAIGMGRGFDRVGQLLTSASDLIPLIEEVPVGKSRYRMTLPLSGAELNGWFIRVLNKGSLFTVRFFQGGKLIGEWKNSRDMMLGPDNIAVFATIHPKTASSAR